MKRHPRHIELSQRWPERYFTGLSQKEKLVREKELLKRRTTPYEQLKLGKTDNKGTRQKSHWTLLFHKTYPDLKFKKEDIAKKTGISKSTLNTVYNRGLKAWKTGGSRVGATPAQWAVARVYKFVLISKKKAPKSWYATRFDPDQDLRK